MEDNIEHLMTALRRFALERHRYLNQLARTEHLTRAEFDTLDYLQEAGELQPTALAARLGLTTGAVTSLLDKLEKVGLVKRTPHPGDRRSIIVRLTKRSNATGKSALRGYVQNVAREARRLSPKERDVVIRFLEGVTDGLAGGDPH